ncbi:hypothetical protein RclHR1_07900003 [Rhizophagus clarus]|uniref:Uncharacterized protein n=1 Tax=Rhizophagus clarus TaxID=94130 RepID=A0A2Z6RYC4_9GLOM|nr:hypothetical protein RclHR1_07900003 [Rhizophagus clarus]GES90001.1 hypothetical protein RCL_e25747_RclHR1_07900003 [Rhizophagus clarus]
MYYTSKQSINAALRDYIVIFMAKLQQYNTEVENLDLRSKLAQDPLFQPFINLHHPLYFLIHKAVPVSLANLVGRYIKKIQLDVVSY